MQNKIQNNKIQNKKPTLDKHDSSLFKKEILSMLKYTKIIRKNFKIDSDHQCKEFKKNQKESNFNQRNFICQNDKTEVCNFCIPAKAKIIDNAIFTTIDNINNAFIEEIEKIECLIQWNSNNKITSSKKIIIEIEKFLINFLIMIDHYISYNGGNKDILNLMESEINKNLTFLDTKITKEKIRNYKDGINDSKLNQINYFKEILEIQINFIDKKYFIKLTEIFQKIFDDDLVITKKSINIDKNNNDKLKKDFKNIIEDKDKNWERAVLGRTKKNNFSLDKLIFNNCDNSIENENNNYNKNNNYNSLKDVFESYNDNKININNNNNNNNINKLNKIEIKNNNCFFSKKLTNVNHSINDKFNNNNNEIENQETPTNKNENINDLHNNDKNIFNKLSENLIIENKENNFRNNNNYNYNDNNNDNDNSFIELNKNFSKKKNKRIKYTFY
jgi:hypothetical protein